MHFGTIAAIAAIFALAGCAGTDSHTRILEKEGAVRVDPAPPGQPYDFVVSIRNVKDIGYDPDNKATRDELATRMLREQCPSSRVIGETVINTGEYLLGNAARSYAVQVRCKP
ncbi:hypothetical protein DYI24_00945 [Rhodopseudomonas sp. BR0C11]|uniref:hypothetical protein n=1 Tax=Rhodopseudomonas sp. BR0C11 TaxID=2269370 RepID=UPI0013DE82DC|nr:hypothetical protein [Rhodopseudomonas sp. BR0C11]NEV75631.1 hypothetical protein [Rhodopseudomonas sp. BR0C11]